MKRKALFLLMTCFLMSFSLIAQNEVPETKKTEPDSLKMKNDNLLMTADTLLLEGVSITAERPLFSVEGEKTVYQVSDDPGEQARGISYCPEFGAIVPSGIRDLLAGFDHQKRRHILAVVDGDDRGIFLEPLE